MIGSQRLPAVILGTWNFGKQVDESTTARMIKTFLDRGHRKIDTAYTYCEGLTEEILGRVLKPIQREKIYLSTKVHPKGGGLTYRHIAKRLHTSLKRLKTDFVDLLYLHLSDPTTPIEVTFEACHKLFVQGKLRELGLSNFPAW